jgi:hypothetical protein
MSQMCLYEPSASPQALQKVTAGYERGLADKVPLPGLSNAVRLAPGTISDRHEPEAAPDVRPHILQCLS